MSKIQFNQKYTLNTEHYYLGLDVGTNSIGWAVTDKDYNIIKKNGKSLWGCRLFDPAQPAVERRSFRANRRRRKRTKVRIKLLQEYFAESISKIDPGFYQRIKDSFFLPEDKDEQQFHTLLNDSSFTDKEYHSRFPTIYHLRYCLMNNNEIHDPRLVYLACHHIMKNRGNFLVEGNLATEQQLEQGLKELQNHWTEETGYSLWEESCIGEISNTLLSKGMNSSDKVKSIQKCLVNQERDSKEICKLIVGNSAKLSFIFDDSEIDETELKTIKFSDGLYDNEDIQDAAQTVLGERKNLVDIAYNIYNAALLQKLLQKEDGNNASTISEARISIYDLHARDLNQLKSVIKKISKDYSGKNKLYFKIFRENKKGLANYVAYSGHSDSKDNVSPNERCSKEEFYKLISDELKDFKADAGIGGIVNDILSKIEKEEYLPKITSSANGIIPHQLHGKELEIILCNAQKNLEFLTDDVRSEIMQIFNFRIPYFIGPFSDKSTYGWMKRRSYESIRPWNINEVVDIEATAEAFIRRMTNKCTYLLGEDVLPKESLLYSEYLVLNALNTLTVDSHRLDKAVRDKLCNDLFVNRNKSGRITKKRIISALKAQGITVTEHSLGGMDLEIPAKLKSKKDFDNITGDILSDKEIEEIIEKITVFPNNIEMLKKYLKKDYKKKLDERQIDKISHLTYKDWGKFSKKFLTGIKHIGNDGIHRNIIQTMRDDVVNLMEVLDEKRYSFKGQIDKINEEFTEEAYVVTEEYLDALRLSPAVKKAVRQTLLVCKEVFSIMNGSPERVFIEMARENGEKNNRTKSRKQQLSDLYANCKQDIKDWSKEIRDIESDKFKSKKLYLYYLQWGRCMYSGEPIPIDDLFDNSKYDIDHIYPRSLTKDDSWDNLVLVKQELNRSKSDTYPIDSNIQDKCASFWHGLFQCGFMKEEKYKRLTRKNTLTTEELSSFINRQIVETRQSTKSIAEIFKRILPKTETVYVKANLVSDFRYRDGIRDDADTKFYFPKVRIINDFHHAKDAYLNIVVGNSYHVRFTKRFYLKNDRQYNLVKFFDREIYENDKLVWNPGENGTIATVKKTMYRNNVLLSYGAVRKSGGFFDQMLVKKGKGQHPIKNSINKLKKLNLYGGFNKEKGSHFCVFQYRKGEKQEIGIEALPIYLNANQFSKESIIKFLGNEYSDPVIICPEIKYGHIIEYEGVRYRVKAKTGNQIKCAPAIQASYKHNDEIILKDIERSLKKESISESTDDDVLDKLFANLCIRLVNEPFSKYRAFNGLGEKLIEQALSFQNLHLETKMKIIVSCLKLLNGNGEPVDLSMIVDEDNKSLFGKQSGSILIVINNKDNRKLSIIDKSITGFYENVRKVF